MPDGPSTPPTTGEVGEDAAAATSDATVAAIDLSRRHDHVELALTGSSGRSVEPGAIAGVAEVARRMLADLDPPAATWQLAADHPGDRLDPFPEAVASALDLRPERDLFQLRRPLPVPAEDPCRSGAPPVTTRPFLPGVDDDAWIQVNNRAFAAHPDQGAETRATLADRLAEPGFDPQDFLVADDDDRPGLLAGFCWTKLHPATDTDPLLGEIYVIGADPVHRGRSYGLALTLAGLDHLADRGPTTANLYVESDNAPALALYDRLGFTRYRRRRVYAP